MYVPERGLYGVTLTRSGEDDYAGLGPIALYYDDGDGRFVFRDDPGRDSAGRARGAPLTLPAATAARRHSAGPPGWWCVVLGAATVEMGVTGLYLWLKRRGARNSAGRVRRAEARTA